MPEYSTVRSFGAAELEVKKSLFLAAAWPVATEAEALGRIEARRREHRKANHHVFAYTVGVEMPLLRASDDGEPAGTAGKPVLERLEREELRNTLIVVTRYFGGTLLGTGGLVRAYGEAARLALAAAGSVRQVLHRRLALRLDYSFLGKVDKLLQSEGHKIETIAYSDVVEMRVLVKQPDADGFVQRLTDLTGGQAAIAPAGELFVEEPR